MHIEKKNNLVFHITLSGYELATLISSARWVAEGAKGELTAEAIQQLKQVVSNYDRAADKLTERESK
ncbi:hypothetical protein SAMN05192550_0276 [Flavobacterium glycines]|jgi:hypothetical protein|uniref:Uncharacterized protein n=1 Tax=Flavobacterium glycines TaxID=551990 RepID=A0A1B9DPM6_9FLAO|nr:hypothetical protein [Flavobacterium glycines]OCB71640.1 hypothetical protein FBGL_10455 [Flavobacterium glycines]GEL10682.1 hypothetical protein FGL01_14210 [Flavobacterium glycines]SDI58582.1 hypothetical protein SAMN05192550_0276 [Flavobacterium glycines]